MAASAKRRPSWRTTRAWSLALACFAWLLGPPVEPFYRFFFGGGFYENRLQQKGCPYSNLKSGGPRLVGCLLGCSLGWLGLGPLKWGRGVLQHQIHSWIRCSCLASLILYFEKTGLVVSNHVLTCFGPSSLEVRAFRSPCCSRAQRSVSPSFL